MTTPLNIVAIGGGTGLPVVLRGLKRYFYPEDKGRATAALQHESSNPNRLTAIVTVTDDGGSSGKLRRNLNVLPPGDIRNCLVALADTDSILPDLLQYRFTRVQELNGHSIGNLLLAALSELTHDFQSAISTTGKLLNICGRVLPSTLETVVVGAKLKDGRVLWGETAISTSGNGIERVFLRPENPSPVSLTLETMASAHAIILGPGSLYTSLIPNLLVKGIVEAISSSPAKKICIMNLMTQPGETDGYTAEDHLDAIFRHCGRPLFDYVILNAKRFGGSALKQYRTKGSVPLDYNLKRIIKKGVICPIEEDVACETTKIRHDPGKLARTIIKIIGGKDHELEVKGWRHVNKPQASTLKPPTPTLTSNLKLFTSGSAVPGRIPLNKNLSKQCSTCLWFVWSSTKKDCVNRETRVCPIYIERSPENYDVPRPISHKP